MILIEKSIKHPLLLILFIIFGFLYLTWSTTPHQMICGDMNHLHLNSHISFPNSLAFFPLDVSCYIFGVDDPYILVLRNHSTYDENKLNNDFSYDTVLHYLTIGPSFRNISTIKFNYACTWYTFTWSCLIDLPQQQHEDKVNIQVKTHLIDETKDKIKSPSLFHLIISLFTLFIISLATCCVLSFVIICLMVMY